MNCSGVGHVCSHNHGICLEPRILCTLCKSKCLISVDQGFLWHPEIHVGLCKLRTCFSLCPVSLGHVSQHLKGLFRELRRVVMDLQLTRQLCHEEQTVTLHLRILGIACYLSG